MLYDVHFWIGRESTADEYGTAAYKTVELDTFLDDKAVQHREVDGFESDLFKTYFNRFDVNSSTNIFKTSIEVCADDVVQKNDESSTTKPSSSENKTPPKTFGPRCTSLLGSLYLGGMGSQY
ncbi:unnamed protein product [Schistosoma mattheei]|uniref:Gelsolin-like domain-containing protein n=1 Tax=Schistosoma mattheei TaxID=31246 RepID=A0A3P8EKM2_9TREM|nr:unnamed protein product [Schistosoma mattheei]